MSEEDISRVRRETIVTDILIKNYFFPQLSLFFIYALPKKISEGYSINKSLKKRKCKNIVSATGKYVQRETIVSALLIFIKSK